MATEYKLSYTASDINKKLGQIDELSNNNERLQEEIAVERARINNITTLQEGSTTGDAELADIRVGANGKKYDNAGEAVRTQFQNINKFIVNSDIEYEIVEGKKYYNGWIDDAECFTVFIKIPDKKFANICATQKNALGNKYGNASQSIVCDADKQFIVASGSSLSGKPYTIFDYRAVLNNENAAYFALCYVNGTEVTIKINGVGIVSESYISLSKTELPDDFIVEADNLITRLSDVAWTSSNNRWDYYALTDRPATNFFEVTNGDVFYHNSSYIQLHCFDENYNYIGTVGATNTNKITVELNDTIKFAYAWCANAGYVTDALWLSRKNLVNVEHKPNVKVNEKYIDLSNKGKNQLKSWYNGKRVSFMGDSLTGTGTGSYYIGYLDNFFAFADTTNCGVGGTCVAGNGTKPFWSDERVNSVNIDSDIVFIMGGTNDANNNLAIGENSISNHDVTTFYGAYNVLLSKLLYKFYKLERGYYSDVDYSGVTQVEEAKPVQIFLITPPYMLGSETAYNKTPAYADAVVNIGKLTGFPVCDTRANAGTNIMLAAYYNKNGDYVHLNTNAHKQWAKVIIGKMLEVEPIE